MRVIRTCRANGMRALARCLVAFSLAWAISFLPRLLQQWNSESPIASSVKFTLAVVTMPGVLVGVVVAGGNVHGIQSPVVEVANIVFYAASLYFLLTIRAKSRERRVSSKG
jgi:hypothetical protein